MSSSGSLTPSLARTSSAGLLDDLGARVVVLVDAVAEAHQLDAALLVLDLAHEVLDVAPESRICSSISSTAWLAPPCSGPEQRVDAGGDRREEVGVRRADQRTVEVEQFCSWSACRISSRSSARSRSRVDLVGLGRVPKVIRRKFST
jgi:hypothetical protein